MADPGGMFSRDGRFEELDHHSEGCGVLPEMTGTGMASKNDTALTRTTSSEPERKRSSRITIMENKKREEEERRAREEEEARKKAEAKRLARERRKQEKYHAQRAAEDEMRKQAELMHGHHMGDLSHGPNGAQDMVAAYALFGGAGPSGQPGMIPRGVNDMLMMMPGGQSMGMVAAHMAPYAAQGARAMAAPPTMRAPPYESASRKHPRAPHSGWTPIGKVLKLRAPRLRNTRRRRAGTLRLQSLCSFVRQAAVDFGPPMGISQARLEQLRADLNQGQKDTVLHLQSMIKNGQLTQEEARTKLQEVQKLSNLALNLALKNPTLDLNQLVHMAQHVTSQQQQLAQQQAAAAQQQQQQQHAAAAAHLQQEQQQLMQQQLLSKLSGEKLQQLRSMSRSDQQRVIQHLMQQQLGQQRPQANPAMIGGMMGHAMAQQPRQPLSMQQVSLMEDPLMMNLPNLVRQ